MNSCAGYYSTIFEQAGELKSQAGSYHSECEKNLSSIAAQISRLHSIKSDISAKVLADKNIGVEKAKNVGFDYSGIVLDIKTENDNTTLVSTTQMGDLIANEIL